ncbi:WD40 repeat-like protein [Neoconidiobolus thromboides FSU 785]|nr:WD40 repeat-like protein [Neoconidiobolus thromboides FSU 785]
MLHTELIREYLSAVLLFLYTSQLYGFYYPLLELVALYPHLYFEKEDIIEDVDTLKQRIQEEIKRNSGGDKVYRLIRKVVSLHEGGNLKKITPFLPKSMRYYFDTFMVEFFDKKVIERKTVNSSENNVSDPHMSTFSNSLPYSNIRNFKLTKNLFNKNLYPSVNNLSLKSIEHIELYSKYDKIDNVVKLLGHIHPVFNVKYDLFANRLITGSDDGSIKVWDIETGFLIFTLKGHYSPISDMMMLKNTNLLLSCDSYGFIVVWDLGTGKIVAKKLLLEGGNISSVYFFPYNYDKQISLCATTQKGTCHIFTFKEKTFEFDLLKCKVVANPTYGDKSILTAAMNSTGTIYAFGGEDFMINIFMPELKSSLEDLNEVAFENKAGALKWELPRLAKILYGHTGFIASLFFNGDGTRLLSAANDQSARIWSYYPDTQEWYSLILGEEMDLSKDDGKVRELKKGFEVKEHAAIDMDKIVGELIWASNDDLVIVTYFTGAIRVFCSHSGKFLRKIEGFTDRVQILLANPKNKNIILAAGYDGNIMLFDCTNGAALKKWKFEEIFISGEFAPNGLGFSLGCDSGSVYIYEEIDSGRVREFKMKDKYQAFEPDFVNVPPIESFPTPGTVNYRNFFKEYSLRDFDNNRYDTNILPPDNFGIKYLDKRYYLETTIDYALRELRLSHYRWPALKSQFADPEKYQYRKFKRLHDTKIPEDVLEIMNEPVELPPSPNNDPDFILEDNEENNLEFDFDEEEEEDGEEERYDSSESDEYVPKSKVNTNAIKREGLRSPKSSFNKRFKRKNRLINSDDDETEDESKTSESAEEAEVDLSAMTEYPIPNSSSLNRPYVKTLKPELDKYFPQIEDEVVYLRSGHQEFIDNIDPVYKSIFNLNILPYIKFPDLTFAEIGRVIAIIYKVTDNKLTATIKIRLQSNNKVINVELNEDFPRFLVEKRFFDLAMDRGYLIGTEICTIKEIDICLKVDNLYYTVDPWNQICSNDKKYGKWEISSYPFKEGPYFKYEMDNLGQETTENYKKVVEQLMYNEDFVNFINMVDLAVYFNYFNLVAYPMFLRLIYTRLLNNYYRSEQAIARDIKQIQIAAKAYNRHDSEIVRLSNELQIVFNELVNKLVKVAQLDALYSEEEDNEGTSNKMRSENDIDSDQEVIKISNRRGKKVITINSESEAGSNSNKTDSSTKPKEDLSRTNLRKGRKGRPKEKDTDFEPESTPSSSASSYSEVPEDKPKNKSKLKGFVVGEDNEDQSSEFCIQSNEGTEEDSLGSYGSSDQPTKKRTYNGKSSNSRGRGRGRGRGGSRRGRNGAERDTVNNVRSQRNLRATRADNSQASGSNTIDMESEEEYESGRGKRKLRRKSTINYCELQDGNDEDIE